MNSKNDCFGIRNVHSILKIFWNVQPVCFLSGDVVPLSILLPSEDAMHIVEEFWGPDAPRALPLKLESLLAVHLGWFGYMGHC